MSLRAFYIFTAVLFVPILTLAQPISMIQDEYGIECKPMNKASEISQLIIDNKDSEVLIKTKKNTERFQTFRFSGPALHAKSESGKGLLFQIYPNSSVGLFLGEQIDFFERDCKDTGASKTCSTEALGDLFWSTERLKLTSKKHKIDWPISHYGVYPKNGTYFHALPEKGKVGSALALTDLGAPVELLAGSFHQLNCVYKK